MESGAELSVLAQTQLAELRSSLKWLVAASGAVAAAIVAGVQFKDLSASNVGSHSFWWAGVAALVTLVLVIAFLSEAARILTLPRPTAYELAKRERRANVGEVIGLGKGNIKDPLIRFLYMEQSYLFSESTSISELYRDDYVRSRNALILLKEGESATWRGDTLTPSDDNKAKLQKAFDRAEEQIPILENVAHLELTRSKYQRLINTFPYLAFVFIVAVAVFVVEARTPPPPAPPGAAITTPTNARVTITERTKLNLPPECHDTDLEGVAVGGTWDKPTVITQSTPQCPTLFITNGNGILALPIVQPATPGKP